MEQLSLSLSSSLSRRRDPQTSRESAEKAKAFKARDITKIWTALTDFGPMTYREIAQETMMEPVAVGRRMRELERGKLIEYTGTVRDGCREARALP